MRSEYKRLLKDTVMFLRQEDVRVSKPKPIPLAPKPKTVPPAPVAEKPKVSGPKPPSQTNHLILDKLQKHLPHLRLISSLPKSVALLGDKNELFFQNLAKAIESRFCKVEWIGEDEKNLDHFTLVIGTKKIAAAHQILLEPIQHYQNNPNEKKQLWSQICHHLSQRSS